MTQRFFPTGNGRSFGPAMAMAAALAFLLAPAVPAQEAMPPATVVTAPVTVGNITEEITLAGTTRPIRDSLIASEVAGRVLERRIERGDFIRKGAPLFILDQVRLKRALAGAQAQLQEVEARLARALRAEGRATELHESKILSSSLYDDAISERLAQEGRKEQVASEILSIQDDLERSVIRAPFAGVVTELHTEVGQWLRQGDPIARLADFSTIEITVDLPERYYAQVVKGAEAPATLTSIPDLTLMGTVFAVVPQVESAARTFPVLVRAKNPEGAIAAGMLAQVSLSLGRSTQVLQVPRDALVVSAAGTVVYKVEGDAATQVPVTSGRASGILVEVSGVGLKEGDRVVIRGNERLMPGQKIVEAGDGDATSGAASAAGSR